MVFGGLLIVIGGFWWFPGCNKVVWVVLRGFVNVIGGFVIASGGFVLGIV